MAYRKVNSRKRTVKKYTDLEKLAYKMGQVERGLNNSNSKVYASYKKGKRKRATMYKKPLI